MAAPPRPTHFLALRVSHPRVVAAFNTVHAGLVQHAPHLREACVDAVSAHLTLGVLALVTREQQQQAADALMALAGPLADQALLAPVAVQLGGLSHFNNKVLFLDIAQDSGLERLMQLAAASRAHFAEHRLLLQARQAFVPHVTVAKSSKLVQQYSKRQARQGQQSEQLPQAAWVPHAGIEGGRVELQEIQLCAMAGRKQAQYYPILCSLRLDPSLISSDAGCGPALAAAAAPPPATSDEQQAGGQSTTLVDPSPC